MDLKWSSVLRINLQLLENIDYGLWRSYNIYVSEYNTSTDK